MPLAEQTAHVVTWTTEGSANDDIFSQKETPPPRHDSHHYRNNINTVMCSQAGCGRERTKRTCLRDSRTKEARQGIDEFALNCQFGFQPHATSTQRAAHMT